MTKQDTIEGGPEFFENEPAQVLYRPEVVVPEVPSGTEGRIKIVVGVIIDETGAVTDARIEKSEVLTGQIPAVVAFEDAALAAARRTRFRPATEKGVPVKEWRVLSYDFDISAPGS